MLLRPKLQAGRHQGARAVLLDQAEGRRQLHGSLAMAMTREEDSGAILNVQVGAGVTRGIYLRMKPDMLRKSLG
jgi:hypothetical protein